MADLMQYVNRSEAPQNNQEMLTSYEWALQFTHAPNIVFMPSEAIQEIRMTDIGLNYGEQLSQVSTDLRGFKLNQPGLITTDGSITLNYQDFEDQAIAAMIQDWAEKCNTRDTHRSAHKRDIYADIIVYRLNSFRKKVCQWECKTCIPTSGQYGDSFNGSKSAVGKMSLNLSVEWMQKTLLNTI